MGGLVPDVVGGASDAVNEVLDMKFDMGKDDRKGGAEKRYRVELSLTGVLGLGTILLLGLVWVFIFGVLVGRGYQPEQAVPELAKIMPDTQSKKVEEPPKVIQPEELTFLDKLRESPMPGGADAPKDPEPQVAPAPVVAAPAEGSVAAVAAAPSVQPSPPVSVQPDSAPPAAAKPAAAGGDDDADQTRYDYVYQVASVNDPDAALRFRDKIRGKGLQSEVKVVRGDDGKYWHRVEVFFQGRPVDTREMKAKLQALGVDKPLLRSKKPVS